MGVAMAEAATVVVRATCLNTSVHAARGARLYASDFYFFFVVSSEAFVPDSHVWLGACQHLSAKPWGGRFTVMGFQRTTHRPEVACNSDKIR
jgi:hypothetical protein